MATDKDKITSEAAERILETASDLFYRQGYRATGINEVIEKSGVAKATFYKHFPTKDHLCLAYLGGAVNKELSTLDARLAEPGSINERFFIVIEWLRPWLLETEFRGCAFLHMVAEEPDASSPLRKDGKRLYDNVRQRVEGLCRELLDSDKKSYGHLDPEALAQTYMLLFAGAIALCEIYSADWPVDQAVVALRRLIGK